MRTRNILLASLMIALCGCKPEIPQQYSAHASEWLLAKETGCFMCHNTSKNLLGPAWENVSERYRNNPDAEAHLENKILNGGGGVWSSRVMPAYTEDLLTAEDRKILVDFIASLDRDRPL